MRPVKEEFGNDMKEVAMASMHVLRDREKTTKNLSNESWPPDWK
jgi:hypothetical protein